MKKKIKTIEIVAKDFYGDNCLVDSVNSRGTGDGRTPQGFVKIYEVGDDGKKKLLGKHNLVVYQGRAWLAQRIMNSNNAQAGNVANTKDEWINWFGLGDGGVLIADPLDPVPPTLTDTELESRIMINATDSSAADYHIISPGYPEEGYYKIPFESVEFEQDPLNDDMWLISKTTITVGVADANGKQLSEAGLFTSASDAGGYGGPFHMLARVTFPSIVKTVDRRLVFSWFLYV